MKVKIVVVLISIIVLGLYGQAETRLGKLNFPKSDYSSREPVVFKIRVSTDAPQMLFTFSVSNWIKIESLRR
ncbi:MAG: hypothetical protein ABIK19_02245 [candidate division WOR-3 bacterium]